MDYVRYPEEAAADVPVAVPADVPMPVQMFTLVMLSLIKLPMNVT